MPVQVLVRYLYKYLSDTWTSSSPAIEQGIQKMQYKKKTLSGSFSVDSKTR
ncbi:hypothetical protein GQR60_19895 [Labilibaculum sp. A4]|uniref:hypothetical protein n=1 Tax=Labilibaculum euxinus TaxID=2686357 RepID=UPI0012B59590|nr:hypothetical protein [Labilibaculum euxinus]MWN78599.1 hypothetical protein [Labilibaculum euxinus]